jgi:hypothetical protein
MKAIVVGATGKTGSAIVAAGERLDVIRSTCT